jgi:hypothetical protein
MTDPTDERAADPVQLALRLAPMLPEQNALIGALALSAHGYPRATDDVDFVSNAEPPEIQARLAAAGIQSSVRRGDFLEGDIRSCVYGTVDGIRFDVLFPPVPINWSGIVTLPIVAGQPSLRVVDLETLLRLKLKAGGPQDLIDVVQLVRRHPEKQRFALDVAQAYGIKDRLENWLADPRIRSPEEPPPLPPLPEEPAANGKRARPAKAARSARRTARR